MTSPQEDTDSTDDPLDGPEAANHSIFTEKALEAQTDEERRQALVQGLMRFGGRYLRSLFDIAQMCNNQGIIQDLANTTADLLMEWLDGKQLTEQADEDERRAGCALAILKAPRSKGAWTLASRAIMALPVGHKRRDVHLVRRSLLACFDEAQANDDVDEQAAVIGALLSYQLLPVDRSLELLDHGRRLVNKIPTPFVRHDLLVEAMAFCAYCSIEGGESGDTDTQQRWASRAAEFLDLMFAVEPDFTKEAKGRNLYATVMMINGKSSEALRAFAETVDTSDPREHVYQNAAVQEQRFRMASGEYERVVQILSPLIDILEEKYLTAVADHTITAEGEVFSEVSWALAFAHAHLDQWPEAVSALERGKSLRLRYRAALRRSSAGRRFLELEAKLYTLERGVPLELPEFVSDRNADRLGADILLDTKVLEEYRRLRRDITQRLPPPPTIGEMAATLKSDEAVVSFGVSKRGGTLLAVICRGDEELPSGRFLLGDQTLGRWVPSFAGEQEDGWMYAVGAPEAGVDHRPALNHLLRGVDEVIGQPLAEFLRSRKARRVTIIPHSWFHQVPFWALPSLAEFEVLMAASAAHFTQARDPQQLEERRALVVADPTCDLPASLAEAEAVTRHLSQLGIAVERLQREAATEESVISNLNGAGIFHFCGHGLSDSDHPTRAALFVHPDLSRLSADAVRGSVEAGTDLLQALPADVKEWQDVNEYERLADLPNIGRLHEQRYLESTTVDRRLEYDRRGTLWRRYNDAAATSPLAELWTAGDILVQESLGDCRLAFLSACEAGVRGGVLTNTDEYSGLPAALQLAGVNTIICSLWPVSDALTTFYVDLFYAALVQAAPQVNVAALVRDINARLRRMKKDEAVALLKQLQEKSSDWKARFHFKILIMQIKEGDELPFQHPYDWAAFYVTGTGDITLSKENSHEHD